MRSFLPGEPSARNKHDAPETVDRGKFLNKESRPRSIFHTTYLCRLGADLPALTSPGSLFMHVGSMQASLPEPTRQLHWIAHRYAGHLMTASRRARQAETVRYDGGDAEEWCGPHVLPLLLRTCSDDVGWRQSLVYMGPGDMRWVTSADGRSEWWLRRLGWRQMSTSLCVIDFGVSSCFRWKLVR
ncbi:uncharacterized protein A4U43_C05F28630 [Asparagus officinalis]|uniref:Uncharacterized protein n=1 Tax=Asparagus officinalis TaxID=4686 RepID=A0A5P1EV50_ASPOF|nr:uncharacterized protein A4U43_C05F28630 [Asparagus officinalis]